MKRNMRTKRKKTAWNKGRRIGQKSPLSMQQIHAIRARLKHDGQARELALFDLAVDSALKVIDLVRLRAVDISTGQRVRAQVNLTAPASKRRSTFVLSAATQASVGAWIKQRGLKANQYLFPSRIHESPHLSSRQYSRLVESWVESIGLNARKYGTHSLRRTKPALIYGRTKDFGAVQALLGNRKMESTQRYLASVREEQSGRPTTRGTRTRRRSSR